MSSFSGKVDIVLATYNGERYLPSQLHSIIMMQGFNELVNKFIVCDDNSTDSTLDIVRESVPLDKLVVVNNDRGMPYGPAKNFERGIALATSEYIMLSDQDDIWEANKLVRYVEEAKKCNPDIPLIIFSDLEVVDSNLEIIDSSFLSYQSIDKEWINDLNNLLIQNLAPGCTMMFNQKLLESSLPFPEQCLMHDWWLMLVCKLYGEIIFIDDETFIKYRQHGNNQVGAKKLSFLHALSNFSKSFAKAKSNYSRTLLQMADFKNRFGNDIPKCNMQYIDALSSYLDPQMSTFKRLSCALKVNLRKSSALKTVGTYFIIFKGLDK
jgi:glycosyltransferase involved in cell wall biosynthesis